MNETQGMSSNYIELVTRDTAMRPIIEKRTNKMDGPDHTYIICPACNCVLNQYDRFCRWCGQRIKVKED